MNNYKICYKIKENFTLFLGEFKEFAGEKMTKGLIYWGFAERDFK